ncbi:hypothetical protein VKT23_017688 [Stygiomarasmius scandens]|uniref:Uncharacterized protein n=1 Tax=Marasmiellus scandens TaxID=2682957 RepID=A0ABR1IUT9_9AGAR
MTPLTPASNVSSSSAPSVSAKGGVSSSMPSNPTKAATAQGSSSTPTKTTKASSSQNKASSSKSQAKCPQIDPFTMMGNAFCCEDETSPLLFSKGKKKAKASSFGYWVVRCHSFVLVTTDENQATQEYLRAVDLGSGSPVLFGTDDVDAAMRFKETGVVEP